MSEQLMKQVDLVHITGKKRYSKQVEWFKRMFSVDVVRRDDGSIVMTWATYESLSARRVGIMPTSSHGPAPVELCFD
ncbi:DUF4224 domain-containing protein [Paraburkholderia sp.]|uniref:DUF4224 domain-containing protein n=1 Tax=Paraburkholderia sp. TaxID=1926495 RepID=UPI0025FF1591|nr:DUF4224 domain-containing protein [Paraburkholderia sp.]